VRERSGKQDDEVGLDKTGRGREPAAELLGDEVGGQRTGTKPRLGRDRRQKGDVVLHTCDIKIVEGAAQSIDRRRAIVT
jgi:hypothetical protein